MDPAVRWIAANVHAVMWTAAVVNAAKWNAAIDLAVMYLTAGNHAVNEISQLLSIDN